MEVIYSIFVPLFDYDYITSFSTVKLRVLNSCEQICYILLIRIVWAFLNMKKEPDFHPAPMNQIGLPFNDPADGNDLKLRLLIRHIVGIVEPYLTAAHADALTVYKHIEKIFAHHGLAIALVDSLVFHIF